MSKGAKLEALAHPWDPIPGTQNCELTLAVQYTVGVVPPWHSQSSGIPLASASSDVPPAMSHQSDTPLPLQSGSASNAPMSISGPWPDPVSGTDGTSTT